MHLRHLKNAGPLLLALAAITVPIVPAIAGNVLYNFNSTNGNQGGWTATVDGTVSQPWAWNLQSSSQGGGWQAFTGTDSANSGSYLVSPCLEISQNSQSEKYVNVNISHRFDFPLSGTNGPNTLGQVQFRVDPTGSGTAFGNWTGVPTQYFVQPNGSPPPGNYAPNYGPTGLFSPLIASSGTNDVQAWSGTTLDFATGNHQPSEFTLFFSDFGLADGYDLQLRFLMATNQATSGTNTLNWEVNSVQIKGVTECVVPEPAGIALATTGLIAGVGWYSRRRRRRPCAVLMT